MWCCFRGFLVFWFGIGAVQAVGEDLVYPSFPGLVDARFDHSQGSNGAIYAILEHSDGWIYVGGEFNEYGGRPAANLVRINAEGYRDDDFQIKVSGTVYCMTESPGGKLLVGGLFSAVNGEPVQNLAVLDPAGEVDPGLTGGVEISGSIRDIAALASGKVLIGGGFSRVNGKPMYGVARLSSAFELDPSFSQPRALTGLVKAIAEQPSGGIVIGGSFALAQQPELRCLARLEDGGGFDFQTYRDHIGFQAGRAVVYDLGFDPDGGLIVAGDFGLEGEHNRWRDLIRLRPDGGLDENYETDLVGVGPVRMLHHEPSGTLVVAGDFIAVNPAPRLGFARLEPNGALDQGFDSVWGGGRLSAIGSWSPVDAYAVCALRAGGYLIGGEMSSVRGVPVRNLVRLHGGPSLPIAPRLLRGPTQIAVDEGEWISEIYVGVANPHPRFEWIRNGVPVPSTTIFFESVSTDGGSTVGWSERSSHSQSLPILYRLEATLDDALYPVILSVVQGEHIVDIPIEISVTPRERVAGEIDLSFNPTPVSRQFHALAPLADGRVYAAGQLWSIVGFDADPNHVVRYHADGAIDLSFQAFRGSDVDLWDRVFDLVPTSDGALWVAGDFQIEGAGGLVAEHLARLQPDGSLDAAFKLRHGPNGTVTAIEATPDGGLWVLGEFTEIGGQAAAGIALVDSRGAMADGFTAWANPAKGIDAAVADSEGNLIVGGWFNQLNGIDAAYVARVDRSGKVDADYSDRAGLSGPVRAVRAGSSGEVFVLVEERILGVGPRGAVYRLAGNGERVPLLEGGDPENEGLDWIGVHPDLDGGWLYVAGVRRDGFDASLELRRYDWNGQRDFSFRSFKKTLDNHRGELLMANHPAGGLLIGGQFHQVLGIPRQGVARLFDRTPVEEQPTIQREPVSVSVLNGESVSLGAWVSGAPTPTMQWFRNGAPLPGQTRASLNIEYADSGSAGWYHLVATNPLGETRTRAVDVEIQRPLPGSPDQDFQAPPELRGVLGRFLILPDDRVLVAGDFVSGIRITRLRSDASLDSEFVPTMEADADIAVLDTLADGSILVGGGFRRIQGLERAGLALLGPDGVIDARFDARLSRNPDEEGLPRNPFVVSLGIDSRDRLLISGSFDDANGEPVSGVVRLLSNGAVDPSFRPEIGDVYVRSLVVGESDSVWVVSHLGDIWRLDEAGHRVDSVPKSIDSRRLLTSLNPVSGGGLVIGGQLMTSSKRQWLEKWTPEQGLLGAFPAYRPSEGRGYAPIMALDADENIYLAPYVTDQPELFRLNRDGSLDASFHPVTISGTVSQVGLFSNGDVLVGGAIHLPSFSSNNLIRIVGVPNPVRLRTNIRREAGEVVIDGATLGSGTYQLEYADSLGPAPEWRVVRSEWFDGLQFRFVLPAVEQPQRYYRAVRR